MNIRTVIWLVAALSFLGILAVTAWTMRPVEFGSERFLMDTLVSIRVSGHDQKKLKKAVLEAFVEMQRIAALTDRFPGPGTAEWRRSDVCRVNAHAGSEPQRVDPDVYAMIDFTVSNHALTEGAFDITIGPVMDLWGFGGSRQRVPADFEISKALAFVDISKVVLNRKCRTVYLAKSGMSLDLGAVAKGYAVENALQVLKRNGIKNALIDAGGTIRVIGRNRQNRPWKIGIKSPWKSGDILAVFSLRNAAVATSADYYRYFESWGVRYGHILSPQSGCPATVNRSVTVIADDAARADLLSTAFFVLKPEKVMLMAIKMGVDVFIVTAEGRFVFTPALKNRMELVSEADAGHEHSR